MSDVRVCNSFLVSVLCTDLAASVPQRHRVVVGGVGPGAGRIDAAQLVRIMMDEGISCRKHIGTEEQSYLRN